MIFIPLGWQIAFEHTQRVKTTNDAKNMIDKFRSRRRRIERPRIQSSFLWDRTVHLPIEECFTGGRRAADRFKTVDRLKKKSYVVLYGKL